MRKLPFAILIALLGVFNLTTKAQAESNYLLNNNKVKITTFYASIAPMTSFSSLNDQPVNVMDLAAGLIINRKFYFAYFLTGSNNINVVSVPAYGSEEYSDWIEAGVELENLNSSTEFVYANFKHSGLKFGYIHNSQGFISYQAGLMFGFIGGFQLSENKSFMGLYDNVVFKNNVITLEPNAGVVFNLLPWWRIHMDLGYRLINIDERVLSSASVDSYTFKLSFAFGKFN